MIVPPTIRLVIYHAVVWVDLGVYSYTKNDRARQSSLKQKQHIDRNDKKIFSNIAIINCIP